MTELARLGSGLERAAPKTMTETFREILTKNPDIDVVRLREMAELLKWAEERDAAKAFAEAMRLAQEEMRPIVRNAENSQTHSKYATLDAIDEVIRPIYVKHGMSLSFNSPGFTKDGVTIACTVFHSMGHSKEYSLQGELDMAGPQGKANKTAIQGLSSSISYLQRVLTRMIFNLSFKNADRDGNRVPGFIVEDQAKDMEALIAECGLNEQGVSKFLEFMNVKTIREIQAGKHYATGINFLEAKRKAPK